MQNLGVPSRRALSRSEGDPSGARLWDECRENTPNAGNRHGGNEGIGSLGTSVTDVPWKHVTGEQGERKSPGRTLLQGVSGPAYWVKPGFVSTGREAASTHDPLWLYSPPSATSFVKNPMPHRPMRCKSAGACLPAAALGFARACPGGIQEEASHHF